MQLIATGTVVEKTGPGPVKRRYRMGFLDRSYLEDVLTLQNRVYQSLKDQQTFVPDPREFYEEMVLVEGKGLMIGIFVEDQLIAGRSVSFPGDSPANLGYELGLPQNELHRVAVLESSMVLPQYRGNRLQAVMLEPTMERIKQEGYALVLCTVSPFNYPSLKNVMDAGLLIRDLHARGGLYAGKLRFLLAKDLRFLQRPHFYDACFIRNTDVTVQKSLLSLGYAGYQLEKLSDHEHFFLVHYGKPDLELHGTVASDPLSKKRRSYHG